MPQHFPRLTGQPQIVVGGQAFIVTQLHSAGRIVGALKNSGAFVHFIKHGNVKHLCPGFNTHAYLIPIKLTFLPRYLPKRRQPAKL